MEAAFQVFLGSLAVGRFTRQFSRLSSPALARYGDGMGVTAAVIMFQKIRIVFVLKAFSHKAGVPNAISFRVAATGEIFQYRSACFGLTIWR